MSFGDPVVQEEMRAVLRKLLIAAQEESPDALGFIVIGIPRDRCPRVLHDLETASDGYEIMRALVSGWDAQRVTVQAFDKAKQS